MEPVTEPPYLRIADEIRGRIESGALRPGERVPSAREITREWTVAIATATRALATLQAEGLTRAVPGIGTVVAHPPAARRPPQRGPVPAGRPPAARPAPAPNGPARDAAPNARRAATNDGARNDGTTNGRTTDGGAANRAAEPALSRDRIVRVAMRIADAEGLAEVSMRRIATTLDVATMSLYRHVAGKDELVVHMLDAALGEQPLPASRAGTWRERLERVARVQWRVFRRHPWLAPAMSLTRPQLSPNAVALANHVLGILEGIGMPPADRLYTHLTLFSFIRGVASAFEPEAQARRETGITHDEWMARQETELERLAPAGTPLRRLTDGEDVDLDLDQLFEFGLVRLLDGIAARHAPGRSGGH